MATIVDERGPSLVGFSPDDTLTLVESVVLLQDRSSSNHRLLESQRYHPHVDLAVAGI